MTYRPWTEAEVKDLKATYDFRSAKELSEYFQRPVHSIRNKMNALGLRFSDVRPYTRKAKTDTQWSDSDIKYLKKQAQNKTASEIGKHLGKTEKSVRNKASRLGISLNAKPWTKREMDILCCLVEEGFPWTQIQEQLGRSAGALRAKYHYIKNFSDTLTISYIRDERGITFRLTNTTEDIKSVTLETTSERSDLWSIIPILLLGHPPSGPVEFVEQI